MFELPEVTVLAGQLKAEVTGQRVRGCVRGNSPHKFVFYGGGEPAEYESLVVGKTLGPATARAKWIFIPLEPGYVLAWGEFGGRLLLHDPGARLPAKHHLLLELDDGRSISAVTQMWGFFEVLAEAKVAEHKYAGVIGVTPTDDAFTYDYWQELIGEYAAKSTKKSVKALLTQDATIPGVGNSYLQDILFQARLHPKRPVADLSAAEGKALYEALTGVMAEAIAGGGRDDEVDLYGQHGGYRRVMDRKAAGQPCSRCGTTVEKIQYLGGACYLCPSCQV